jgi:hypothetical protein
MGVRQRVERLAKHAGAQATAGGPLTVFLREAGPGLPVGRRVVWDGVGLEIVFDSAAGWPTLPPGGPHKLILGLDPDAV